MHNLNKLYQQIRRYFIFHPMDRYGIIALIIICTILIILPDVYFYFKTEKDYTAVQQQKISEYIAFSNHLDSVNAVLAKTNKFKNKYYQNESYGFEPIEKNAATTASKFSYKNVADTPTKPVDINTASASDFKLLKGIGKVFSERIIKYRNSKNGFNKIEDLNDVYGISDSLYTALLPRLTISKKPEVKNTSKLPEYASKPKSTIAVSGKATKTNQPISKIDINTATAEELKTLKGIGNVLSERIVKFRDSKGGFEKMEDLNDVYGIKDSLYYALANRIEMSKVEKPVNTNYPDKKPGENSNAYASTGSPDLNNTIANEGFTSEKRSKKTKDDLSHLNININTASKEEWMLLNGIGEFRAKAIVEHRQKLGGFHQLNQIVEAYSIDDSLYQTLLPSLTLGTPDIKKININEVEFKALLKHPYIDYNLTKHLINFRDQRKGLKSIEDLKDSYLIDQELYQKLSVYLTVE